MENNKKLAVGTIIFGAILTVVGIIAIVLTFTNPGVIDKVISYSIAACCFVLGLTMIIASIATNVKELFNMTLVVGSIAIAIGIVLCIQTGLITGFLVLFLAALLLALGAVSLAKTIIAIVHKEKASIIVTLAIAAAITITVGILGIIGCTNGNDTTVKILYAGLGTVVTVVGIVAIVRGSKIIHDTKKAMKAAGPVESK